MSKEQKKVTEQANGKGKGIDKALVAAAEDINEVFRPAPVLDTAAKTLAEDLKELFPAMGKGKGLKAETIKTLKGLGFLEKAKPVEKPAAKAEGKRAGKVGGGLGKPGVITTIIEILKGGPVSKKDILRKLLKKFPERGEKAMASTINCQVPKRLIKEKSLKVVEKDGKFSIK